MPTRTSAWLVANAGYVSHGRCARHSFVNEQTRPPPGSAPCKNEPAPRFFPPTKVVRAHRGLHNIFVHSTAEKMQRNNLATMPQGTPARANVESPKSARVYSSKA